MRGGGKGREEEGGDMVLTIGLVRAEEDRRRFVGVRLGAPMYFNCDRSGVEVIPIGKQTEQVEKVAVKVKNDMRRLSQTELKKKGVWPAYCDEWWRDVGSARARRREKRGEGEGEEWR